MILFFYEFITPLYIQDISVMHCDKVMDTGKDEIVYALVCVCRWIIAIILCCLILLVVMCNVLGLMLGPSGLVPKNDPTDRSSTANCGGLFLMAYVQILQQTAAPASAATALTTLFYCIRT